jgi:uncharacterized phage protein gp47/JayE
MFVDENGIQTQTLEEIRNERKAAYTDPETGIDPELDVSDDSVFGRLIGIESEREYALQQQVLAIYNDTTVAATGVGLTRLALVTGTVRRTATFSTVTLQLSLNAGVTVPAGKRVQDASGAVMFETLSSATNPGGSPAVISVVAQSLEPGPVLAPANTLTTVVSGDNVTGWTSVTNATAAVSGAFEETDPALRIRRTSELNSQGSGNLDAIVTRVEGVAGATAVRGYENKTDSTDVDGLPPHSFEIVVWGTADPDEVAQAIFGAAPAGISSAHGTAGTLEEGIATDRYGSPHTIAYTLADEVTVYVRVDVDIDPDVYPADGDAQIQENVTAAIQDQVETIGSDVLYRKLYSAVYAVPGVEDVTLLAVDDAPAPTLEQNLVIGSRGVPVVGTITVNS